MHYSTIISLDIPEFETKKLEMDLMAYTATEEFKKRKSDGDDNVILEPMSVNAIERLYAFNREILWRAYDKLERYYEGTDNPDYLEFADFTEELEKQYQNETVLCVKLPNGLIYPAPFYEFGKKYCVKDGKVYKKSYGPNKVNKRTKKSKRIKVYEDYPFNKLFRTFKEFADDFYGYLYNEEKKAYGYYYNPYSRFNWCQVGGRWPELFLVKDEFADYIPGSIGRYKEDCTSEVPDGYRWVYTARIKDIEWKAMYDWKLRKYTNDYESLKSWFEEGTVPEDDNSYAISEKGISSYCTMVYKNGQSFEGFLRDRSFIIGMKYPLNIHSFLDDNEGWKNCEHVSYSEEEKNHTLIKDENWESTVEKYISSLDENTVLVGVDIHI